MLAADGEPGAEVYSAAVTRDQARISFDIARTMVLRAPGLQSGPGIEPLAHNLYVPRTGSVFRPLASDADGLDGLNIHCAIIDELHAHKTREVYDALDSGTGSRRQPLLWIITTAGVNRAGVCYEQRNYLQQILEGRHRDDRFFGLIYTLDEDDDWTQVRSWRKANPNYAVSVLPDDVRTMVQAAQANPQSVNNVLTKRFNIWVSAASGYFNMLAWRRSKADIAIADYEGESCWLGLDLASKVDIAALSILFRASDHWAIFGRYYLPEDAIEPGQPNYDFYRGWAREGRLILTPGTVIDFEFIERDLMELNEQLRPAEVCYDPYQATELSTRMAAEGLPMVEVGATVRNFSEPMKSLAGEIIAGNVKHDGDPVLDWMMGNVTAKEDAKENVYPRKDRPENKIDGAIASLMPFGRAIAAGAPLEPGFMVVGL
jgi:phage terminase large subunit-like protein